MEPAPSPGNAGARGPLLRVTNLVLPGYLLAAVLFTWPLARTFTSAIPSSRVAFDPPMQAFLLGWDSHALLTHPLAVFNAPIFHPEPNTLAYMDHLLGETFLSLPVLAIGRSIPAA